MKQKRHNGHSLKWTAAIVLVFAFFAGCRKYDSISPDTSQNYEELKSKFFNTNSTTDIEIKKLAADIKKQDSIFKFLPDFVRKNGLPKWDKVIYKTSSNSKVAGRQNSSVSTNSVNKSANSSSSTNNNDDQGVFFIPLQSQNSQEIKSYITAYKHNDSLYTYRLYNKDSLNAVQAGSTATKNNLLNTQAVFGFFEKSINNVDSVNINAPINATIKNVNISFDSPSSASSNNTVVTNSMASSSSCTMSITVTIQYSLEIWTDGNSAWIVETVSVSMEIAIDCSGGGGGGGSTGGGSTGGGSTGGGSTGGGSTGGGGYYDPTGGGYWWNYGSGWPWYTGGGGGGYYDPNWYWWWTGGGGYGGGSGSGFSPTVTTLSNQLGLSYSQSLWLENNPLRANEIYNYLQSTTNPRANSIAIEHIDKMMSDLDYLAFNQQYYLNNSSNNVWWEDDNWLDNPNNFNLDLDQDQNGQYDRLTAAEKALVKKYPTHAYMISKNKPVAEQETVAIFGQNGLNDKSDAFRHAFFNAMNRRDLGLDPMTLENIAKLFSDAHESEVPPQLQKEKDMDLWNNAIGHIVGNVMFPIFTSNSSLSSDVLTKLTNGELRYLKPVLSPSQDPNFWGANGVNNPSTATHGITNSTQLTPTNQ